MTEPESERRFPPSLFYSHRNPYIKSRSLSNQLRKRRILILRSSVMRFQTGKIILSRIRKYGLNIILAHHYTDQLDEKLRSAIFGNVGTIIFFLRWFSCNCGTIVKPDALLLGYHLSYMWAISYK